MRSSKLVVLPYKIQSASAANLASALSQSLTLRVRRVFSDGAYRPTARSVIINWGHSSLPSWYVDGLNWWNHPSAVRTAANKTNTFMALSMYNAASPEGSINLPLFTPDRGEAEEWITRGAMVVCRTVLSGHSGHGIVVATTLDQMVDAPLYTQYIKKAKEFRVHVAFDKVIDIQQKRKRSGFDGEVNNLIRNHDNGWVYCREDIVAPDDLVDQALRAIRALGLVFGAVDIIYNQHYDKSFVLEVNCAPGLEGTTVEKYKEAFLGKLNE